MITPEILFISPPDYATREFRGAQPRGKAPQKGGDFFADLDRVSSRFDEISRGTLVKEAASQHAEASADLCIALVSRENSSNSLLAGSGLGE